MKYIFYVHAHICCNVCTCSLLIGYLYKQFACLKLSAEKWIIIIFQDNPGIIRIGSCPVIANTYNNWAFMLCGSCSVRQFLKSVWEQYCTQIDLLIDTRMHPTGASLFILLYSTFGPALPEVFLSKDAAAKRRDRMTEQCYRSAFNCARLDRFSFWVTREAG